MKRNEWVAAGLVQRAVCAPVFGLYEPSVRSIADACPSRVQLDVVDDELTALGSTVGEIESDRVDSGSPGNAEV